MVRENKIPEKVLVIRLSAIGDVAMCIPVLFSVARNFPNTKFHFLSQEKLSPLFNVAPANVIFEGVNIKRDYSGIKGLNRLYSKLSKENFDAVADLHDVLRTKYLRFRFCISRTFVAKIDKGRDDKRRLVRNKNKVLRQLPTSFSRYYDVFSALGFKFKVEFKSLFEDATICLPKITNVTTKIGGDKWIGIAPFASFQGKIYPLEKMEAVIKLLLCDERVKIFLFGGGKTEEDVFNSWTQTYNNVTSLAGKLDMKGELAYMSQMDVVLSMDSANMHLASLVNVPVVSIWGATHPFCGFMGWGQDMNNAIQVSMACRPCSVYGNKKCISDDYACLNSISPETVVAKIYKIISK